MVAINQPTNLIFSSPSTPLPLLVQNRITFTTQRLYTQSHPLSINIQPLLTFQRQQQHSQLLYTSLPPPTLPHAFPTTTTTWKSKSFHIKPLPNGIGAISQNPPVPFASSNSRLAVKIASSLDHLVHQPKLQIATIGSTSIVRRVGSKKSWSRSKRCVPIAVPHGHRIFPFPNNKVRLLAGRMTMMMMRVNSKAKGIDWLTTIINCLAYTPHHTQYVHAPTRPS